MTPRHHTVPQLYLVNFANPAKKVMLVDRNYPSRKHLSVVRKAITEVGFYRIETEHLARASDRATFDPESVEAGLSALETAVKPTIDKLVHRTGRLDDNDWYRLIQFTALQTVRGNRWREILIDRISARIWDEYFVTPRPTAGESPAANLSAETRFPRVVPPQAVLVQESLKMALGTETDIGIGRYLAEKTIRFIRPSNARVLTSDEPVVWWSPGDDSCAYALATCVWMPLSPALIVEFADVDFDRSAHDVPDSGDDLVTFVNGLVASQAHRWIVHHPDDNPLDFCTLPERAPK
ncbi:DUF4238 domain-containing protein [Microbacterium sp. NPDC008134]|uniref:DUF4238 domain-containing protein n=1 Tax=Microbacterium sp. NPDC008134 TaxID=3364183 RepID=UPI0036E0B482